MANGEKIEVGVGQESGVQVVTLRGPVDSVTLEDFKNALEPVFQQSNAKILLDCKDLTYINSRAIGMLTKYRRRIYTQGGRLALCSLDSKIVRTLDLLGLTKVLRQYESRAEAIQALNS